MSCIDRETFPLLALVFLGLGGCGTEAPPANRAPAPNVEQTVRAVLGERLKVNPEQIDMDRPLAGPPLNADDLDFVEIVMDVEERLGIHIPDDLFDRLGPRITPRELVTIAGGAKIRRQTATLGWPVVFTADALDDARLREAFDHCLTEPARAEARACAARGARQVEEVRDQFLAALAASRREGG